jgi:glycosyltransferase involved in cell wall biosynthesis
MGIRVTYGITVCDEYGELESLLDHLKGLIDDEDEIIILRDATNTNEQVTKVILRAFDMFSGRIISLDFNLNNDFATLKNKIIDNASGDVIFQIDADEIPHPTLIQNLKGIVENNPEIDVFCVPRVNKVIGITNEDIQKWGWVKDEHNRINWYDPQTRIFRTGKDIKFVGKVHEMLQGYQKICIISQDDEELALFHIKSIEKQRKQNEKYSTIQNDN